MAAPTATLPGRRPVRRPGRPGFARRLRQNLTVLSFMAPVLIGITVFFVYPLVSALYFSFTKFNLLTVPQWVGLDNYKEVLHDTTLREAARNTVWLVEA